MREMKFRAWDVERGRMFEPRDYCYTPGGGWWITTENTYDPERHDRFKFDKVEQVGDLNASNPESCILMQWTGLVDKKGTPIFEGDVVRYLEADQEVAWSEVLARPILKPYTLERHYDLNDKVAEQLEVVGNRWEHPDLLPKEAVV